MKLRMGLAAAALLLVAADDTPEREWVATAPVISATVAGAPARLRLDPGGLGAPILNPDFAARAGIRGGLFGVIARVGPVKVPGATAALPMINTVHAWLGTSIMVGGEEVQVRFSTMRDRSVATASAGNAIAEGLGGRFDRPPERMTIYLGVERPVRHVALETPLVIGPLSLTGLMVRTGDFGSAAIPDADESADPDEIVVTGRKKQKRERRLEIGRDQLDRCSSIVFDKPARLVTLTCR